jgi:hypothetical protein
MMMSRMKNYFLWALIFVFSGTYLFSAEPMEITLITPFKLNPITGINGDEYEASSKFVQRMIFSPLVFPLQDPYLQDDYSVELSLSLIEEKIQYRADNGSWMEYDLAAPASGRIPSATAFKVKLRENLNFYKYDDRSKRISFYSNLFAEDVVYSYRLSRITIDRAYQAKDDGQGNLNPQGLNTLLYAKIKSFDDIYCNDNRELVFEMDSQKSCVEFKNLLVYVPILSITQILGANSLNPNDTINQLLRGSMKLSHLFENKQLSDERYNRFDFNYLLRQRELIKEFFNQPVGFGQYLVERTISYAGADKKGDEFKEITLVRNPNWCTFGDSVKQFGIEKFNHADFAKRNDKIAITVTKKTDSRERISESLNNTKQILYNIPLSAAIFSGEALEKANISAKLSKRKMQISHSLYGIFFGPSIVDPPKPMAPEVRRFFGQFVNRTRIENIIRFIATKAEYELFNAAINDNTSITSDLELQRLYVPFYVGIGGESPIVTYYREKEREDMFVREYLYQLDGKTDGKAIKEYFNNLSSDRKDEFFKDFVGGDDFPEDYNELLQRDLNNTFIKRNILVNNEIHIEIVHKTGDDIGRSIAFHYQRVLQQFFRSQTSVKFDNNWIQVREIQDYSRWRNLAIDNAGKKRTISLLVKGWNYKFDLLDELKDQFVDDQSLARIKAQYNNLINRGAIGLEAAENYKNIAAEFVDKNVIIPLVGVQNYVVYSKGYFSAFDMNETIEILLLPYYWSEN